MARPIRIEYKGAWYHVSSRGNERREIYRDNADREKFLDILSISIEQYAVEVHAYVLMANHYHLIVKTKEANLQKFMQRFNTSYTVYYNRKYRRTGHLYQGRYKAILIESDSYLLELSRYVHLNPVRIKKHIKRSLEQKKEILNNYQWSSFAGYVYMKKRLLFVSYKMIMEMQSGKDDRRSRRAYERFVMDRLGAEEKQSLWDEVRGQTVLGTDSFVDYIYRRFLEGDRVDVREQTGIEQLRGGPQSTVDIARAVVQEFRIKDVDTLYRKRSSERQARAVFVELCRRYLGKRMSMAELGRNLGNISGAAISVNMKRLKVALQTSKQLQQKIESVEKKLNRRLS
ncbi:MAG: hypothetical protein GY868_07385 [Deltaproteobacteria bacterium]|nr:hypothetical protein [Deltaproteobacteria bacterium]